MAAYGASDALIGRRPQRGLWALLAIIVPVLMGLTCELFHYEDYEVVVGVLVLGELVAFFLWPAIAPDGEFLNGESRGRVKANREGLWVNKKLLVPRHWIDSGFIEGHVSGRPRVHLSTKRARHQVWVEVEDDSAAEALLSAMDLRPDRRALSFEVEAAPLRKESTQKIVNGLRLLGSVLLTATVMYCAHINALFGFTLVPVLVIYTLLLRRLRRMTKIAVGADGLSVRVAGKQREIPHKEVKNVTRHETSVLAETERDGNLTLRFYGPSAYERSDALATALRNGMNSAAQDASSLPRPILTSATSALACGGRTRIEWLKDLKRITCTEGIENSERSGGSGGSGGASFGSFGMSAYRGGVIPDEDLWSILEHPSAHHEARAGALVALSPRLTEESRVRISELAAATIHKDLKAALLSAANGDSDEEILAAFESNAPPAK